MNGKTNVTTTSNSGGTNVPHIPPNDFVVAPGDAKTQITWTDPNDLYASPEGVISQAPYQLVSKWTSTKIVRSETDYPATPNDGILAVESNIRDEHKTSVFEDTNLNNGTVYYYSAFGMNEQGLYSQPSTQYAEVRASIPMADGYVNGTNWLDYEPVIVGTQNHAVIFGSGQGVSAPTSMALNKDLTEINLGNIPQISSYDGYMYNSVCSLDGCGYSFFGIQNNGNNDDRYVTRSFKISSELTISVIDPSLYAAKFAGAAATSSHIILYGGMIKSGDYVWGAIANAVNSDGTSQQLEEPERLHNDRGYGGSISGNAIFATDTQSKDICYNDELVKSVLSSHMTIGTVGYGVANLSTANTPNHIIFHPGNNNGYAFDNTFTLSNAPRFAYNRTGVQGITMGNYAMYIGGTNGSYINGGDGPKHMELYQIQYYDIGLTLNTSDSIFNELENPNPDEWWDGVAMLIKVQYSIGTNIDGIGIIGATTQGTSCVRFYRFKLA